MFSRDAFVEEFERLLANIPTNTSFRQLQFDYRQVAFLMGQKILERFPEILVGNEPRRDEPAAFQISGQEVGRRRSIPFTPEGAQVAQPSDRIRTSSVTMCACC
jgi:hypothetical protein